MDMSGIIAATLVVGITGLVIGVLLGIAGKFFAVTVDEKEQNIRKCLPGNNCGGCGYAGCDALAHAIFTGEAKPNACPVGGAAAAEAIGKVLGGRDHSTVVHGIKKVAEDVSADEAVAKTVETIKKKINPN